tara:strand:- start:4887 stop:5825 length:939 start_codon:yes stop_codon:yes gene_type:complete
MQVAKIVAFAMLEEKNREIFMERKGIILAGGKGSRLHPVSKAVCKQLLPVYDKPMIYYPLSVLMLASIKSILIITNPDEQSLFKKLLGDGKQFGLEIHYQVQPKAEGIAQSMIIAEEFLDGSPSALILGDNIFFGHGLPELLAKANRSDLGACVFGYRVGDPERYGILQFDERDQVSQIIEKPINPPSQFAVTGLYFLDSRASEFAKNLEPSDRGEIEITSLLEIYLKKNELEVLTMGRGYAWLDTGTFESLLEAGAFVKTLQNRQGLMVGCLEEIAFNKGWISSLELSYFAESQKNNEYGQYLQSLVNQNK